VSLWKDWWGWSKVLDASRILGATGIRVGQHSEDVCPIDTQDLLQVRVSIYLLCAVVFMEILTPTPFLDVRRSWNRGVHLIEGVRTESVRIVQEHDELKHRFFVVRQVNEGALGYLSRDVSRMNTMVSPCVINIRAEEPGMSSSAVVDPAE
jgi:hypothetical protein